MNRLPGLDLLRAIAIGWVMLYHLASYGVVMPVLVDRYGYMGVDLFFVLSGFLIGAQLLAPYTRGETPRWGQFFLRRVLRVLPAYLVVLALYFIAPSLRESPDIEPLWQFLTFTQNIFADYERARAFSHAWSLCIEEHFYLLLPAAAWLLARKPSAGKVAAAAFALLAGGMLLRGWIWQHEVAPLTGLPAFFTRYIETIYNPTWCRLDGLLAGVMLAVVQGFRPAWWDWLMARGPWLLAAGLAGVYVSMRIPSPGFAGAVIGYPLLAASLAALVVAAVSPRTWLGRWRLPGVAPIAAMAFSLYLTHKAVFHWIAGHFAPAVHDGGLLAFCVYVGAALAVGGVLYLAVERPSMRLRSARPFTQLDETRRVTTAT